ncbi:MAG: hypothetical protein VW362_01625 [Candidatus Nanopelagicales bacterium]
MEAENIPTVDAVRDAVDGRNNMIHAVYQYRCDQCGSVELIGLGCGVEGPRQGATEVNYIASPFGCNCLRCGGSATHFNWGEDAHFPLRDAPMRGRYFRVPKDGPDSVRYGSVVFAGDMGNPDKPVYR